MVFSLAMAGESPLSDIDVRSVHFACSGNHFRVRILMITSWFGGITACPRPCIGNEDDRSYPAFSAAADCVNTFELLLEIPLVQRVKARFMVVTHAVLM